MKLMTVYKNTSLIIGLVAMGILFAGCAGEKPSSTTSEPAATSTAVVDNHSGWWCAPHGIPEEVCSMCSAKYAAECKEKGDWCVEHDRAESQCFICDPTRAEKFAKLYEAKYGTKPPAIN
jgi:hypothetical protein